MSGAEFIAIYDEIEKRLTAESTSSYGRQTRHAMGGCSSCNKIVCLTHHECKRAR